MGQAAPPDECTADENAPMNAPTTPPGRARGVSLLELVLTIVVVGVVGGGTLLALHQVTARSADPELRSQANAVARAYLEEVLLRSFCDPDFDPDGDPSTACPVECTVSACSACGGTGPLLEGSRALFDDVCDYDGLADDGAVDQTGTAIPGLETFNVRVTVDDAAELNGLEGTSGEVVLIDVEVTHAGNDNVRARLNGYRANF